MMKKKDKILYRLKTKYHIDELKDMYESPTSEYIIFEYDDYNKIVRLRNKFQTDAGYEPGKITAAQHKGLIKKFPEYANYTNMINNTRIKTNQYIDTLKGYNE